MNYFKINKRIIEIYNSQEIFLFIDYLNEVAMKDEKYISKMFTSKWIVWNIIRNKDFYKMTANWFTMVDKVEFNDKHFLILKLILDTSNNNITRESFMKAINKKRPILTVDNLIYSDIDTIINKDNLLYKAICDDSVNKLISSIISMKELNNNIIDLI